MSYFSIEDMYKEGEVFEFNQFKYKVSLYIRDFIYSNCSHHISEDHHSSLGLNRMLMLLIQAMNMNLYKYINFIASDP